MRERVLTALLIVCTTFTYGQDFNQITSFPTANKQLTWVSSTSPDNAFITSLATQVLYTTTDGGASWNEVTLSTEDIDLTDIYFSDDNNGWITGFLSDYSFEGVLFRTTDGGVTWQNVSNTIPNVAQNPLGCIRMNGQNGVIGNFHGTYANSNFPAYFLTTDGGETWTSQDIPAFSQFPTATTLNVLRMTHSPGNETFSLSVRVNFAYNAIYTSSDNGMTFSETYAEADFPGVNLGSDIFNVENSVYWISRVSPLKSSDNGSSWTGFSYPTTNNIRSGYFDTPTSGLIVGENSSIYKTVDGGANWTELQSINDSPTLRNVYRDENVIWAIGENSTIYKAESPVGLEEDILAARRLRIFPNPAVDLVEVKGDFDQDAELTIHSTTGREMISMATSDRIVHSEPGGVVLDVSDLPVGVYFLRIGDQNVKMIKE